MFYLQKTGRKFGKLAGIFVICATMGACSATFRNHGYMPQAQDVNAIVVGKDTRETVTESLGKPGAQGLLASSGYYYVRSRFKHYTYNAPQEISREVLAISFTPKGVVENIERFDLENGRVIVVERRVTDSNIKGVGFLKQMFGSFGRIDVAEQLRGR